jgi:hypothetical protein
MRKHLVESFLHARSGRERLWKIWWLCGIPVAWATSALVVGAEAARVSGHHTGADWLDVFRLLIYLAWAQRAWRCAHNVEVRMWSPLSRCALTAGFAVMFLV